MSSQTIPWARDPSGPVSREDWERLEPMLDALLDASPDRRAELIAEMSGDDAVRRSMLERLVTECERAYPLLERPVGERFAMLFDGPGEMPTSLAERYEVVRELGRGGMATVYLARDLRHGRDVAVKVVRGDVALALGHDRFLREVEIVARLHHPHVVPLFDSGRAATSDGSEGVLYYVMPYVEGRSLRERLARDGVMPIEEVILILRDVCDALAYAHAHGVVHRDIKPDNVLLSGRHALVADFGVARAVSKATPRGGTTAAGLLLGTPAYMAPEQAIGDPHVDHRADIYAVGVLAYELLAGRPPFAGDSPHEIVAAQLSAAPEPLATHRPEVPPVLAALVMKCLAKRPQDRWQTADELLARIEAVAVKAASLDDVGAITSLAPTHRWPRWYAWTLAAVAIAGLVTFAWIRRPPARGATPLQPALAVLLFQPGGRAESDPLAIGLTSALIGALGNVPRLDVRSLEAVWPYRDGRIPLDSIGRMLDVRWIVGGQILKLGDRVVVSSELTDAATGRLIARREATAAAGNDISLIEDLVSAVATMLRDRIGDEVRLDGWRAGTRSTAAFDGLNRAHKATLDADYLAAAGDLPGATASLRRADSALANAARADREWVEPLVQRAWVARKLAFQLFGSGAVRDSVVATVLRGVDYARAARQLGPQDPNVLEAHGALVYAHWVLVPHPDAAASDSVVAAAAAILTAATDADTTLARAHDVLSSIQFHRGNLEQARLTLARAYRADAYTDNAQQILGRLFTYNFAAGEDRDARRWCAAYGVSFRDDWFAAYCRLQLMAWDATASPDVGSAWLLAKAGTGGAPVPIRSAIAAQLETVVAAVLARAGSADSARRVLGSIAVRVGADGTLARDPFGPELQVLEASVRVLLREPDAAIALLERHLQQRPDRRVTLSRDRRFRDLAIGQPVDAVGPAR